MSSAPTISSKKIPAGFVPFVLAPLALCVCLGFSRETSAKEQEKEKPVKITEEILVIGKAPKEQPVATVTTIDLTAIDQNKPLDLSEILRYAPGAAVTFGNKDTYSLKLRGVDSKRIALLIDGVPDYEPYFGTFDLKTVSAAGLDSVQITKGPSSVLYGPNTLGGIVNVITRRPGSEPFLTLDGSLGEKNTHNVGFDGGARWDRFSLVGNFYQQASDGSYYPDPANGKTPRSNSDYKRLNANAKIYYQPSSKTEIMVNGGIYNSEYGMPAALGVQRARYWKFKNWDRYTLNAGGYTALGEGSTLRFRAFSVNYKNTLDMFSNAAMTVRQSESTYNNSVYGLFALGDFFLASWNSLKLSLNYENDTARIQNDVGLSWQSYNQGTLSAAVEDHISLSDRWKLIGGLSFDYLDKISGINRTSVNPLVGLKFSPSEEFDVHLSASQKSRFPSMTSMYSASSGNPDLLSERGSNVELGFTLNKGLNFSGAVFATKFKDLIDTYTLPDGTRRYFNIGKAHINGFEIQAHKSLGWVEGTVNYTYLDQRNESNDRPLDAISPQNLNFDASVFPLKSLRLSLYGLLASKSNWFDSTTNKNVDIPSYFNLDAVLSYQISRVEVFLKVTNIFNDYIYSEPIFPWRARFVELGSRIKVF